MLPTARKLAFTEVPVIDLAPAWSGGAEGRRAVADQIAEACGRVGFIYVKNHWISGVAIAASSGPRPTSTTCRSTPRWKSR